MINDLQKASIWKRIAAFMLDAILVVVIATGVLVVLSWATGFDNYRTTYLDRMFAIEEQYGLVEAGILAQDVHLFDVTEQEYLAFSEDKKALYDGAAEAFLKDQEAMNAYGMMSNLLLLFVSIPLLVGVMIVEFVIPLILKNGQTVGKKVFGIAVVRVDSVKITPLQLLVRTLLGKYTIEIMVPALLVLMTLSGFSGIIGPLVILAILILEIVVFFVTKTNSPIHDLLAGTVAVDMASQRIFESPEALLEYKKKLQAEAAADSKYF